MERVFLPEKEMLPRVRMARLYDTAQDGRTSPTAERTADCYELGLYMSDSGSFTSDGRSYEINQGDMRFTRPGQRISSCPPYRCFTVFFLLGEENKLYYNDFLDALPEYCSVGLGESSVFEQLVAAFSSQEPGSIVSGNSLLLQLLSVLFHRSRPAKHPGPAVQCCLEYMQLHFSEKISLEFLGNLTGYSAIHILRLFKNDMGQSPHEYLSALRMKRARQLLSDTDVPVSRLAIDCGFSSESYFHAMFKKQSGMSPGEYRRVARLF